MKHLFTRKAAAFAMAALLGTTGMVRAQITENFDNITTLTAAGWSMQNLSTPVGTQANWFQGNATVFSAFNGATTAYIAANFNFVTGANTISGWLITPNVTLRNGDVFTFYSRKVAPDTYPDRLEVRMSTNGASTNVGATNTSVGDFTTLLMTINPSQVTGVYPTAWTQYTITISGLLAPTSGRLAFRYFVTNGGPSGANSDYIGIDAFQYTPYVCPTVTVTPGTVSNGTAGTAYSETLGNTGALGSPTYSVTAGALPPGLTLSAAGTISGTPTATGTYNFTVTATDASGCSGSQAYSITIACPTGGASMSAIPALCDNGSLYTLVEGSPSGGTYSGTGVTGGMFDPAVGTQTITYTVIDGFGCTQVTSGTATVNTAPTVTQQPFTPVCDNGGMVTLSGGSPAGGMYSGTNVSGGDFDPSGGTQAITYTYTDGNGCSNMASETFTVNAAPVVTQTAFSPVCDNSGLQTLSGGSPAGGTYSGTSVSGTDFDPSAGTQTITYTYTDGNGCTETAEEIFTVNTAPTVTQSTFSQVCSNAGPQTLTGGSPAGGTYSGTNVSGGMFDPSGGAQTITYMYTDVNGCSNTATANFPVVTGPTVTLAVTATCSNSGMVTLTGGSPIGGMYSGTNVSGNTFDPSAGSQLITYTYYDSLTTCSDMDTATLIVNQAPTVAGSAASSTVCLDDANVALTGSPAGGTWSGPGVTGSSFDPSTAGTGAQMVTYTFTDANSCTGTASTTITVNACVGIDDPEAGNGLELFPNPTNGSFTVSFTQETAGNLQVRVLSVDGKVVLAEQRTAFSGTYTGTFDLSAEAKGVYLVEVQHATGRAYKKIVLQ
jgi:hypothetical protein